VRRLIRGTARLLHRVRGYHPARIGGERFRTDPDHIGFWRDVSRGRWEPATFRFLERSLGPDSVFADVGAWIGPTTLFAARRSRLVYGFEPDHDAYRYFLWNLRLNALANVVPMNAALGAETGMRRLYGAGGRLGTSQSSLLAAADQPSMPVLSIAWRDWLEIAKPGRIDCIKMDIEGGEFELLPAMRAQLEAERPALHLSLHAGRLPERERKERLAEVLDPLRVYPSWRNEAGEPVTPEALASVALAGDCVLLLTNGSRSR
jgi:FkbM family methyltransferase